MGEINDPPPSKFPCNSGISYRVNQAPSQGFDVRAAELIALAAGCVYVLCTCGAESMASCLGKARLGIRHAPCALWIASAP